MPTALLFGTSRGLGRALVEEHLKRGWDVIGTVRTPDALADLRHKALSVETLDTTDWPAVDDLRDRLAGRELDLLFVSAGIIGSVTTPAADIDPEAFSEIMRVNALAPLRIIDRFADLVQPRGTLAVMSSSLGSITLNKTGGYEDYRMSKAALDMGLCSIAARRKGEQTFLAIDPGWVQTDMGGKNATLTIGQSVPNMVDMIEARQGSGGVAFVNYANQDHPW